MAKRPNYRGREYKGHKLSRIYGVKTYPDYAMYVRGNGKNKGGNMSIPLTEEEGERLLQLLGLPEPSI